MNEIQRAGILWYNTGITDVIGVIGITDVTGMYRGRENCIGAVKTDVIRALWASA